MYTKLSFWANTPSIPTIKKCKISNIKPTGVPNEKSANIKITIGDNITESQKVIAVSQRSEVDLNGYSSHELVSVLSKNTYKISLSKNHNELEFDVRIYTADLKINEMDLSEEDCFIRLYFIER